VFFTEGTKADGIEVHYPIGHRRRAEGITLLQKNAKMALSLHFTVRRGRQPTNLFKDVWQLEDMLVPDLSTQFVE
jgi:2-methylcitrate dehydratase PrpD